MVEFSPSLKGCADFNLWVNKRLLKSDDQAEGQEQFSSCSTPSLTVAS